MKEGENKMAIERQVVLECVQPNKGHNKFYEISIDNIESMGNGKHNYEVQCRWGRIEHFKDGSPQSQIKLNTSEWDDAMAEVGTIMYAKLKKGYKVVKDTATNPHKNVEFTNKPHQKKATAQKEQPVFDRTEHVEVIVSDWWKGNDNIEERAV